MSYELTGPQEWETPEGAQETSSDWEESYGGPEDTITCDTLSDTDADDALLPGDSERIAGITLVPISDEPPWHSEHDDYGYSEELARQHGYAAQAFAKEGFVPANPRGRWDNRVAELTTWDKDNDNAPIHTFLLNDALLEQIRAETQAKGSELSADELASIGLSQTEGAVSPDFSSDAMNAVNAAYYSSEVAFSKEADLATMFVGNRPINQALGAMLATETGAPRVMRVKELCSGGRNTHWAYKAQGAFELGVGRMDVTLTDFVTPTPDLDTRGSDVTLHAEQYSLFEDMPELPVIDRFDAIITTYGFDSVWQPEDMHLVKMGDQWYQTLYRVKVADWNPRKDELLQCMRDGVPLPNATSSDYDGIVVESAMQPYDINNHPYARHIEELGRDVTNVPGGLIKRIVNAFESQLGESGVFVSGDVGDFGLIGTTWALNDAISGVAARYRGDDYVLAKKILEDEYGLEVTLLGLDELVNGYLPQGWENNATARDRDIINTTPTNGVMVVKRRASA